MNEAMHSALGREGIKVSFTTYNVVQITPQERSYLQPQTTGGSNEGIDS